MSIHDYTDIAYYAQGAFSTVYRARPVGTSTYTEVALKVSNPATTRPPHSPIRERRLLRKLRHANVVPMLSAFYDETDLVVVMPFLRFSLSPQVACRERVIREITSAIAYLHDRGIIHRDIKPQNILLASETGPAYLSDFGTAWTPYTGDDDTVHDDNDVDDQSEPAHAKVTDVGTGAYRAPELLFGYPEYSEAVDLWSWGCVIAELWISQPLFEVDAESSDISLANMIFRKLGTPDLKSWPEAKQFAAFEHIMFVQYPPQPLDTLLPGTPTEVAEIVEGLLKYESGSRRPARQLLDMTFFTLT